MTFTDGDLARVKEFLALWEHPNLKLEALILRLERAEAFIEKQNVRCQNCDDILISTPEDTKLYEAWRDVAGK